MSLGWELIEASGVTTVLCLEKSVSGSRLPPFVGPPCERIAFAASVQKETGIYSLPKVSAQKEKLPTIKTEPACPN